MCVPVLCSVPRIGHRFAEFPERVQYAPSIHSTLEFSGTGSDSVVIPVKRYTSLSEKVVDMIDACRHSCGVALATPAVGW